MLQKFFERLSPRERSAMTISSIILSLMLLDRLIIGPIISNIKTLDNEIEERKRSIRANLRILNKKDIITKEAKRYEKYSVKAMDPEDELASLLGEIESLATGAAVYLVDVKPSGERKEELIKAYLVKINCEGQMEQIFRFMHSLESSKKLLTIESARLRPKERGSETINCDLSISKIVIPE